MLKALTNVMPRHLLDRRLSRVRGCRDRPPKADARVPR